MDTPCKQIPSIDLDIRSTEVSDKLFYTAADKGSNACIELQINGFSDVFHRKTKLESQAAGYSLTCCNNTFQQTNNIVEMIERIRGTLRATRDDSSSPHTVSTK